MSLLDWIEVEERVGLLWHRMVGEKATYADWPEAAITLAEVRPMLAVFFRGLGGAAAVELAATSHRDSGHRLTWRQRLGMDAERMSPATLGETVLRLPERIAFFPERGLNRDLYLWLAAFFSRAAAGAEESDPLRRDIAALRAAVTATGHVLADLPGLRGRYRALAAAIAAQRPDRGLPPVEARLEAVISGLLTGAPPGGEAGDLYRLVVQPRLSLAGLSAPPAYRPYLPVPLWGEVLATPAVARPTDDAADDDDDATAAADRREDERSRTAGRAAMDQADRDDPLILNRFEKLLSLAEMVNVNRGKEDDDEEDARKAADDLDRITVSAHSRKAATRLRLDLDLPPDVQAGGALRGSHLYPEWDYRKGVLLADHCRVETSPAAEEGDDWAPDDAARRLIRRVRRQFEALRPRPQTFRRQADGDDLDLDALVRARADLAASGAVSDRLYTQTRTAARDLSVAVLVDVSLSTDAWIDDRRVLDVEKEALSVFLSGLAACGDENAVFTFTSRRRDWVRVQTIKDFEEPFGPRVLRRIAALKPGYYTRIGAAVRHAAKQLENRPHRHRLLLLLTDGKPNDVDHYEGRFGIEDTRRAILDARRQGLTVFGITIDRKAQDYFPALFGRGHYAIVGDLGRLSRALPRLYQSLSG
jgi:nitric oxide reductase NorD protein